MQSTATWNDSSSRDCIRDVNLHRPTTKTSSWQFLLIIAANAAVTFTLIGVGTMTTGFLVKWVLG